jgi:hypothetical protein
VTCLVWPKDRHSDIYFGLAEGKVRIIWNRLKSEFWNQTLLKIFIQQIVLL